MKINILIVEDEAIVALDIEEKLIELGFNVMDIVDNGLSAIESASNNSIDLILMDINIKGKMDGIDTAKSILKKHDLPIIFLTAYSNGEFIERSKKVSPYGYLLKPFNVRELSISVELSIHKHAIDQKLKNYNDTLEIEVNKRTKELQTLNEHLSEEITLRNEVEKILFEEKTLLDLERKKNISAVIEGAEQERSRIAKELHDDLGQKLTAAKMLLTAVLKKNNAQNDILIEVRDLIQESVREARRIAHDIIPEVLDDYGLLSALQKMTDKYSSLETIDLLLVNNTKELSLDQTIEKAIYRIIQEGVNNAIKHADAKSIIVSIDRTNNKLIFSIKDNGKGFDSNTSSDLGKGFSIMKERALLINANFSVKSNKKNGSEITVSIII